MELQTVLSKIVLILSAIALILCFVPKYSKGRCLLWKPFNIFAVVTLILLSCSAMGTLMLSRMNPGIFVFFTESREWSFFFGVVIIVFLVFIQFHLFQYVVSWIDLRSSVHNDLHLTLYAVFIPLIIGFLKMIFTSGHQMFPGNFWSAITFGNGFWEFLSALSLVFSMVLIAMQLVKFVISLRYHLPYLFLLLVVYIIVFISIVFLAVYATFGLMILFFVYVLLGILKGIFSQNEIVVRIKREDK